MADKKNFTEKKREVTPSPASSHSSEKVDFGATTVGELKRKIEKLGNAERKAFSKQIGVPLDEMFLWAAMDKFQSQQ